MILVNNARELIKRSIRPTGLVKKAISDAVGSVLAEDIYSPINSPPFHQAAMDGYAVKIEDYKNAVSLQLAGVIPAGKNPEMAMVPGSVVRIFTGARVPDGTDLIVMQEEALVDGNTIRFTDTKNEAGANIRKAGSQIKENELALAKGTMLNPAAIGFLAGLGVHEIVVFKKPSIKIIVTGSELQSSDNRLEQGHVYESNSLTLAAALRSAGFSDFHIEVLSDNNEAIFSGIKDGLEKYDVLILCGGISVGDYDLVADNLQKNGVNKIFHGIRQKPGKPMFFGMKENCFVFGLPGNPAACLTCYYMYVQEALKSISGIMNEKPAIRKKLLNSYKKKPGLTNFLKGRMHADGVEILSDQESYILKSFAAADCLIELEEEVSIANAGDAVKVYLI